MIPRWLLRGLLKARYFCLAALLVTETDLRTLGMGRPHPGLGLTICGSWMSARLEMRAWLRPASSFSRLSLLCSISLFSASIVFKLLSIDVICNGNDLKIKEVEIGRGKNVSLWRKCISWTSMPRNASPVTSLHKTSTPLTALKFKIAFPNVCLQLRLPPHLHVAIWWISQALCVSPSLLHILVFFPVSSN